MTKHYSLLCLFLLQFPSLNAQVAPDIEWKKCYGGLFLDNARAIEQTSDSGFIVVGYTGPSNSHLLHQDVYVVKTDRTGNIKWEKRYGSEGSESGMSIKETPDRGYILVGGYSPDTNFASNNRQRFDLVVIKLDSNGTKLWQKTYGGINEDYGQDIQVTPDGGYIVLGTTGSSEIPNYKGLTDVWLLKLNSIGDVEWQRCYGGSGSEWATGLEIGKDGYFFTGSTQSNNGDVSSSISTDAWVVKTDWSGNILWQKSVNLSGGDFATAIDITHDGGCVVTGYTRELPNQNKADFFVVKHNAQGDVQWKTVYGNNQHEVPNSIRSTEDNGYIIVGFMGTINPVAHDYLIMKINNNGVLQWTKKLGGSNNDVGHCIRQTYDGGVIIAGTAESSDGDVVGNNGNYDFWVVKLFPEPFLILGDSVVCRGSTHTYRTNKPFMTEWEINQTPILFADSVTISFNDLGLQKITACYEVAGIKNCAEMFINVLAFPEFDLPDSIFRCKPFDAEICPSIIQTGYTYLWHDAINKPCRTFTNPGKVYLRVYNGDCMASDTTHLVEFKNPEFRIKQLDTLCLDGSNFVTLTIEPDTFPYIFWENSTDTSTLFNCYDYIQKKVLVKDGNNCVTEATYNPIDGCKLNVYIPNAFSPNGDGLNDFFGVEGYGIKSVNMQIFNRWGQLIFESTENNPTWDGTYKGDPAQAGMYHVLLRIEPNNLLLSRIAYYSVMLELIR